MARCVAKHTQLSFLRLKGRSLGGAFYLRLKGEMGLGYIIFNPSCSLESIFGRRWSRNDGMRVLTSRTIESGIRSICHMVFSRVLVS